MGEEGDSPTELVDSFFNFEFLQTILRDSSKKWIIHQLLHTFDYLIMF